MPKARLTPTQLQVLRHAAEKEGQVFRTEGRCWLHMTCDPHFYDARQGRAVNAVAAALIEMKVARLGVLELGRHPKRPLVPTDLGREVLAEYNKEK